MVNDIVRDLGHLTLGSRLKRLGERMQAQTQRILDDHGLVIQAAQFPFLAAIDRLGPSTIGALAEAVGVSQPGTTRTVSQLARAGYVDISTSAVDQRRKLVKLSRKGRGLVDVGKRRVWPEIAAAVENLCNEADGTLLDQLATIEDGLADVPLSRRAEALRPKRRRSSRR